MILFHGGQEPITEVHGEIYLTSEERIAEEYALDKDGAAAENGWLHIITVDDNAPIADEDELLEAAGEMDPDYVYEAADSARVQQTLKDQGYAGVAYQDQTINGTPHDTILLWDVKYITDIESEEITR